MITDSNWRPNDRFPFCVILIQVKIWHIIEEHEYINIAEIRIYIRSSEFRFTVWVSMFAMSASLRVKIKLDKLVTFSPLKRN